LTLTAQDLRTQVLSLAAVSLGSASSSQAVLASQFNDLQSIVNTALGSLGAEARALELQTAFLEEITDATEEGLGNIVDADMARESARLTALQVRQQLGVQVLGIANQAPQILLGLFQ
jgi:flagellin